MSTRTGQPEVFASTPSPDSGRDMLATFYADVRRQTESLCRPLTVEDYGLQAMADASPAKWHLAHTSWFFETFLLIPYAAGYRRFHPHFDYLFNSYYNAVGAQYPRAKRGQLSRPTVADVYGYRAHVDAAMQQLLAGAGDRWREIGSRTQLGCQHEQQHQELLLTDIKYNFSVNPLRPAYRADLPVGTGDAGRPDFVEFSEGIREIGHAGPAFAFDNETPRHRVYLNRFALAARPVLNGDYLEFIDAGGYDNPVYWLSDGYRVARESDWSAPLYWELRDGQWWQFTLAGMRPLNLAEPVCHVSYYEADAYARFAGKRLPTEAEWEIAAADAPRNGNLGDGGFLHPAPAHGGTGLRQLFGDVWEWTQSGYTAYPGFRAPAGALGEYNAKFMANQMVLRGGSCATPAGHIRPSYRNFFYPADRWQFSGFRLADDR